MKIENGRAERAARSRFRIARALLLAAITLGLLVLAATITLFWMGHPDSVWSRAIAVVTGLGPVAVLVLAELRSPSRRRPAAWLVRGSAVTVPQAVALWLVSSSYSAHAGSGVTESVSAILPIALVGAQFALLTAARRILLQPLRPELGLLPIDITMRVRASQRGMPAVAVMDQVVLEDELLVVLAQTAPATVWALPIQLSNITAVDVRHVSGREPWLTVDGHERYAVAGESVVVTHRAGTQELPVPDAAGFAEVLRVRAARAEARAATVDGCVPN